MVLSVEKRTPQKVFFSLAKDECEGSKNVPACVKLGYYLMSGLGAPPNPEEARRLFIQACSSQNASGCYNLGLMYLENHDLEGGFPFFNKAVHMTTVEAVHRQEYFETTRKRRTGYPIVGKKLFIGRCYGLCPLWIYTSFCQNRIEDAISTLGYSCSYGHPDGCFNFAIVVHQKS